jgi:hypothetical protein
MRSINSSSIWAAEMADALTDRLAKAELEVRAAANAGNRALYAIKRAREAPAAPTSSAPPPAAGMVLAFQPDLTKPLDLYHATENPSGLWKPNAPWDKDGEVKVYMEQWSRWPDHPMSRKAHLDLQTFVDPRYNGMNPFSVGPDGVTITASINPTPDAKAPERYVSGLLSTQASFAQRYGYFECDVTRPAVKGTWPAFWLLGAAPDEASVELDVMEGLGGKIGSVYHNAHLVPSGRTPNHIAGGEATGLSARITAGMLWTRDRLAFFVNGHETHSAPNPGFHKPMFLIASMAVGPRPGSGGWADINTPVDESQFPARCTFHRISAWRPV